MRWIWICKIAFVKWFSYDLSMCYLFLKSNYTWSQCQQTSYHKSIVKEANDGSDRKVSEYTEYTICYVWKAVRLLMLHLNMDYI